MRRRLAIQCYSEICPVQSHLKTHYKESLRQGLGHCSHKVLVKVLYTLSPCPIQFPVDEGLDRGRNVVHIVCYAAFQLWTNRLPQVREDLKGTLVKWICRMVIRSCTYRLQSDQRGLAVCPRDCILEGTDGNVIDEFFALSCRQVRRVTAQTPAGSAVHGHGTHLIYTQHERSK